LFGYNTSVVHAFLNARYYNSSQGQFLSEDPVFWGEPKLQNLQNPQSFNTYSYSLDNPITNKDPSGRCGPICMGLMALFMPTPVGDPSFGPNGSISSTPQQRAINFMGFAGQIASGEEGINVFSG
jgi:RHS repeat-associated protein